MTKLKHFGDLKIQHFVIFITLIGFACCRNTPNKLSTIEAKQISVDSAYTVVDSIQDFITPYYDRVEQLLDSSLAYAPYSITKTDGAFNTTAGNLMADIVLAQTEPVFKQRTDHSIDFVLLNHGGIRSNISKGNITTRTAYEVMPFENTVVVVELKGEIIQKMIEYLIKSKRAHPVSGIQLVLNKDRSVNSFSIGNLPIDPKKSYFVATSDYLVTGGDNMDFFAEALSKTETDYKIRNAMIDYFSKVDTVAPKVDLRYYQLQ